MKARTGGSVESRNPPRRHAASVPRNVPIPKLRITATPVSTSVHASPVPITSVTGVG